MELNKEQAERYARQITLPEIAESGQKKLFAAKALVVGLGGLGSSCATYLAAAGIGQLGIADFDNVAASNFNRQVIHSEKYMNRPKTESAADRIGQTNSGINVIVHNLKLTRDNSAGLVSGYDIIADCTDNFSSRYLLNDACIIAGKPFIHAAVSGFFGQAMTILPGKSACYRCLMPEPPPAKALPKTGEPGVIGTIAGLMGIIAANEAIKYIIGAGELLAGKLLMFDALENSFDKIEVRKNPGCTACGK